MFQPSGIVEAAILLTVFLLTATKWSGGNWRRPALMLFVGYSFAW